MSWLSSLLSGPSVNFTPASVSSPGVSASFKNGRYNVTESPAVSGAVSGIGSLYDTLGNKFGTLADTVGPGFNDLLQSRLAQVNNAATKAVGDLRQNLSARRILGSSFGNDTLSRLNAEFSNQRDQIVADNFLRSLDASQQLLGKEYQAKTQAIQTGLSQLNFESSLGAQLAAGANSAMAQAAIAQAQLDAKAQAGVGGLVGSILGKIPFGSIGSSLAGSLGSIGGDFAYALPAMSSSLGADLAPEAMALMAI